MPYSSYSVYLQQKNCCRRIKCCHCPDSTATFQQPQQEQPQQQQPQQQQPSLSGIWSFGEW